MNNLYKYTANRKSEIKFIESHFYIYFTDFPNIYYSTTDKITRKIKILSIDNVKLYNKINDIVNHSTIADVSEIFSLELSKEIDKSIMKELIQENNLLKNLKISHFHIIKLSRLTIIENIKTKNHQLKIDDFFINSVVEFLLFFIKVIHLLIFYQVH